MPIHIEKSLIKERFTKSIHTYSESATVQSLIAKRLVAQLAKHASEFHNVLELGAGTGFLTRELVNQFSVQSILCNDLVGEYKPLLESITHDKALFSFLEADLEQTDVFTGKYDLIASASTLQWILELDVLFARLKTKMKKNAFFAFSTFGENNMIEVRRVLQSGLYYPSLETILEVVQKHFTLLFSHEESQVLYFEEPVDALKHIKKTGVNALFKTHWTKGDLLNFSEKYKSLFSSEQGVSLTYHPIYIIAQNRDDL